MLTMLYRAFLLTMITVAVMMITAVIVLGLPFRLTLIDTFYSNMGITPYDVWQTLFIVEFFAYMVIGIFWIPGLGEKILNLL